MTGTTPPLTRRLLVELLSSAFLAALVIRSGIAAQTRYPHFTPRDAAAVVLPHTP
jgi:hypothetical protein